jgi:hypothetical protein
MKRLVLSLPLVLLAAGCVVHDHPASGYAPPPPEPVAVPVPAPPPAPVAAPAQVWYAGPHFVPDAFGGGWCYEEDAHTHPYFPDRLEVYAVDGGY